MGKTRERLQENQRHQRNNSCKNGFKKYRNGMDLTEAGDIKKRWQDYTEELCKKDLHDPDNHDGVITHVEQISWNVKSSGPQEASYEQSWWRLWIFS